MSATLLQADLLNWLRGNQWLVQNGFMPKSHAILSDPPYFLGSISKRFGKADSKPARPNRNGEFHYGRLSRGFMGQTWDGFDDVWHFQAWVTEWASMLLDFVYPGAIGMFFGGSRTYHRLAAGLEDAGWEVVDCVMYLYGSGFPKALSISKAIDKAAGAEREVVGQGISGKTALMLKLGAGGAERGEYDLTAPATAEAAAWEGFYTSLKPAFEPIVICRAPRGNHTYAELAQQFGTGAYNIDGARIPSGEDTGRINSGGKGYTGIYGDSVKYDSETSPLGRWPSNVILDDVAAELLDRMTPERTSKQSGGGHNAGASPMFGLQSRERTNPADEGGGASRFYFCAKANSFERSAGLDAFDTTPRSQARPNSPDYSGKFPDHDGRERRCTHPTVKNITLTEYLARLILPPASVGTRRLLVPFGGVGSEMIGAHLAGWDVITGIEREAEYVVQGRARTAWWSQFKTYEQAERAYCGERTEATLAMNGQLSIYDLLPTAEPGMK